MLSLSDSWGRSTEDVHRCSIWSGAVLERPVCERVWGGSSARGGAEGWAGPWPGVDGAFDLSDAGGEGRLGAGEGGDMESTLVKASRGRFGSAWVSVWQRLPEGCQGRCWLEETRRCRAGVRARDGGADGCGRVCVRGCWQWASRGRGDRGSQGVRGSLEASGCVHVPSWCGQGLSGPVAQILHKRASRDDVSLSPLLLVLLVLHASGRLRPRERACVVHRDVVPWRLCTEGAMAIQ